VGSGSNYDAERNIMRLLKLAFKRETAMVVLALLMASVVSVALVVARIFWTGRWQYGFLAWNLFLAWLPLAFALMACDAYQKPETSSVRFWGFAGAWLLFFPNAPYIFTDIIHLTNRSLGHFWVDLVLVLLCALTGLVLGFVSLFLMQSLIRRMLGQAASWIFIAIVAGLSGFGIYLGRFLRFNSWDVVFKPFALSRGIGQWASDPLANPVSFAFPLLFSTFLFVAYVMLYALTHLQQSQQFTLQQRSG
jgi:uncharacterized membrane protein